MNSDGITKITKQPIIFATNKYGGYISMLPTLRRLREAGADLRIGCMGQHFHYQQGNTYKIVKSEWGNHAFGTAPEDVIGQFPRGPFKLIVYGDRLPELHVAAYAFERNATIYHFQAGETSGGVDNTYRVCLERLATYRFCSSASAAVACLGDFIGEPKLDILAEVPSSVGGASYADQNPNESINPGCRVLIVHLHVETGRNLTPADELFQDAIKWAQAHASEFDFIYWIKPGNDDKRLQTWSLYEDRINAIPGCWITGFIPHDRLMWYYKHTSCVLMGNSTSGIYEAAWFGCPFYLVGTRQTLRNTGPNVLTLDDPLTFNRIPYDGRFGWGKSYEKSIPRILDQ